MMTMNAIIDNYLVQESICNDIVFSPFKKEYTENMIRVVFTGILLLLVTACTGVALLPTYELVQKAIAIQLEQTQQQLSQKLDLDFQKFDIQGLSITQQQPLTIENLPAYHVQGTYNLTVKLPNREIKQPQKPFEIYLQIQREGKSWRLLVPEKNKENTRSIWHSYLILVQAFK
jgi:hypothetical protein